MRQYSVGVFLNIFDHNTLDWQQQMDFIKSLSGVEHIEVLLEYIPQTNSEKSLISTFLQSYKVIMHAPFMDISLLSPHDEIVHASEKILAKTIDFAQKLSAQNLTIHADRYPNFWNSKMVKERVLNSLERLSLQFTPRLCIENLSYCGKTQIAYPVMPDEIIALAQALSNDIGITLDIGHLLKDGYKIYGLIEKLNRQIFDIHLHDGCKGSAHLALGHGDLDLRKLLLLLRKIKYRHFLTIEVVGQTQIR